MADEEKSGGRSRSASRGGDVISNLPRHRPHRRSEKRRAGGGAGPGGGASGTTEAAPSPSDGAERPDAGRPSTAADKAATKAERSAAEAAASKKTASSGRTATSATTTAAREKIGTTASAKTRSPTPPGERKLSRERPARRPSEPSDELPGGPSSGPELVGTVVQAAGELAQIGLTLGTQAVKNAVKRLPKP